MVVLASGFELPSNPPAPSPIILVPSGRVQAPVIEMTPAGSSTVEGTVALIPDQGLGWVEGQVMLVVGLALGMPRASITAPLG